MKKIAISILLLMTLQVIGQEPARDLIFFANSGMKGNYFFSKKTATVSGVRTQSRLPVSDSIFHSPGNSLKLEYTNSAGSSWQATITVPRIRGQDHFKKVRFFSFWVYKASAATTNEDLPQLQLLFKDSSLSGPVTFGMGGSLRWEHLQVPAGFFKGLDPARPEQCIGMVCTQKNEDGKRHTLYIDDVEFVTDTATQKMPTPSLLTAKGYAKHVDISWQPVTSPHIKYVQIYRSADGRNYKPIGIQLPETNRYADYTGITGKQFHYKIALLDHQYRGSAMSAPMAAATKAMTDDELLTMVQEASFRYYWEGAEKQSGLAKENIPGRQNMIATGASGFGILALLVGAERKFITRREATDRFLQITSFLEKAEKFHGAFSHFIDGPSGKVEPFFGNRDNGGDLVETSFLVQGLLAARAYFTNNTNDEKKIRDAITRIWQGIEWSWYRQYPDSKFLYWHWSPDKEWIINHRLIGWNETMVTYLLAIASPTHAVPAGLYYTGWASQDSTGIKYRQGWGQTSEGAHYKNGNTYFGIKLDVGVSNGGPLFFTHYSYLGYDPHAITDKYTNYFTNNQHIAQINHRYCISNPGRYAGYGDSCWGLTASDGPYHYAADEPVLRQDKGKIGPTGAVSSFPYTPEESMKALKNYYYNYGSFLWGEYGFRDAFNLTEGWCSGIYMGLNQAPMTVMIENYRTGLPWKLLMSDNDVKTGLQKLATETARQH